MKALLAPATIALLVMGPAACGGAGGTPSSASRSSSSVTAGGTTAIAASSAAPAGGKPKRDYDGDATDDPTGNYYDGDDHGVLTYGHAAGVSDRRAIATLVKRYYAAAAADDGATTCSLIDPLLARGLPEGHDGTAGGGGGSCAAAMGTLFEHVPGRTAAALAAVRVTGVRVKGDSGLALLRLPSTEARYMPVVREGGSWKIEALFDTGLL